MTSPVPDHELDVEQDAAARRQLRRIAWCFLVVVATVPLVALGGAWTLVLVLDLAVAVLGLRAALCLRAITGSARR